MKSLNVAILVLAVILLLYFVPHATNTLVWVGIGAVLGIVLVSQNRSPYSGGKEEDEVRSYYDDAAFESLVADLETDSAPNPQDSSSVADS